MWHPLLCCFQEQDRALIHRRALERKAVGETAAGASRTRPTRWNLKKRTRPGRVLGRFSQDVAFRAKRDGETPEAASGACPLSVQSCETRPGYVIVPTSTADRSLPLPPKARLWRHRLGAVGTQAAPTKIFCATNDVGKVLLAGWLACWTKAPAGPRRVGAALRSAVHSRSPASRSSAAGAGALHRLRGGAKAFQFTTAPVDEGNDGLEEHPVPRLTPPLLAVCEVLQAQFTQGTERLRAFFALAVLNFCAVRAVCHLCTVHSSFCNHSTSVFGVPSPSVPPVD
eukprot:gene20583-biopygen13110